MAIPSGSKILLRVDDSATLKTLVAELSADLDVEADMIETTHKDSVDSNGNPVKTYIAGESGFEFSVEGIYDPTGDWSFAQILAALQAGTSNTFQFGGKEVGDEYFSGSGLFQSASLGAPKNGVPPVNASIQGSGELTTGTVV